MSTTSTTPGSGTGTDSTPRQSGPPRGKRIGNGTALGLFLGYAVLVFFSLIYLYPFFIQIATSFKTSPDAVGDPLSLIPDGGTTAAFERLFRTDFPLWFGNSVVVTVLVTAGRVFLDSLAGYALARIKFVGREAVFTAILAVLAVPGVILLIPKFLVLNQLQIYDTYQALVIPLLVDAAGVFIMKQFFENIPLSVEEAARVDGAGTFRIFWSIVLPMARPALITLDDPVLPGLVERAAALHRRLPGHRPLHVDQGRGDTDQRAARLRQAVPHLDGGSAGDDDPGRDGLRPLPALLRHRCQRRIREGLRGQFPTGFRGVSSEKWPLGHPLSQASARSSRPRRRRAARCCPVAGAGGRPAVAGRDRRSPARCS